MKYSVSSLQQKKRKNSYIFNLDQGRSIQIDSNFDSGNISLVKQITQLYYRLESVSDSNSNNKKSWFYFSIKAFKDIKVRLTVQNVSMYETMYQEHKWGKPVYKQGKNGKWKQFDHAFLTYRDQVQLVLDYTFHNQNPVFFALTTPFTYTENQQYLERLRFFIPQSVSYNDQILCQTKNGKNLHLITIQDGQSLEKYGQKSRPIILITCRVHPGEVTSSYVLMGILEFILKPYNLLSQLLRKMFKFIIIPMVNPDGVYEGNYRMDLKGQNLNRVYSDPNKQKHQTIFAIMQYLTQQIIQKDQKILFHFDLHSHSAIKDAFIYGNAMQDIINQTQTQLFCKLLSENYEYFQYSHSQFGQKHMKFKDRGQNLSKQGCARVVLNKLANISYSYTVQASIFPYPVYPYNQSHKRILKYQPTHTNFSILDFQYEDLSNFNLHQGGLNIIDQNRKLGFQLMTSVLDVLQKNPYSRFTQEIIDNYRKEISAKNLQNQERFKMLDTRAYHKSKNISKFAKSQYFYKISSFWNWFSKDKTFNNVEWPQCFKWFQHSYFAISQIQRYGNLKLKQKIKMKTETSQKYSDRKIKLSSKYSLTKIKVKKNLIEHSQQFLDTKVQRIGYEGLPLIKKSLDLKKKKSKQAQNEKDYKNQIKCPTSDIKVGTLTNNNHNNPITCISGKPYLQKQKDSKQKQISCKKNNIILSFIEDEVEKLVNLKKQQKKVIPAIPSFNKLSSQKKQLKLYQKENPNFQLNANNNITEIIQPEFRGLQGSHSQIFISKKAKTQQEEEMFIVNQEVQNQKMQKVSSACPMSNLDAQLKIYNAMHNEGSQKQLSRKDLIFKRMDIMKLRKLNQIKKQQRQIIKFPQLHMKIRTSTQKDLLTNSSSSTHIILTKQKTQQKIKNFIQTKQKQKISLMIDCKIKNSKTDLHLNQENHKSNELTMK